MSQDISSIYVKLGASFANGVAAYADKNRLYPPELTQQVNNCYSEMLLEGILLQPVTYVWDQEDSTLTVVKIVENSLLYGEAVTFDSAEVSNYSKQAGWTFVRHVS
jgi:hypothetical protein